MQKHENVFSTILHRTQVNSHECFRRQRLGQEQSFYKAPLHIRKLFLLLLKFKSSLSSLYKVQNYRNRKDFRYSSASPTWGSLAAGIVRESLPESQNFYPSWWEQDLFPLVSMEAMWEPGFPFSYPTLTLSLFLRWWWKRQSGGYVGSGSEAPFYFQGRMVSVKA